MWPIIEIQARSRDSIDQGVVCSSKAAQARIWAGNITGAETRRIFNRFLMSFGDTGVGKNYRPRDWHRQT